MLHKYMNVKYNNKSLSSKVIHDIYMRYIHILNDHEIAVRETASWCCLLDNTRSLLEVQKLQLIHILEEEVPIITLEEKKVANMGK